MVGTTNQATSVKPATTKPVIQPVLANKNRPVAGVASSHSPEKANPSTIQPFVSKQGAGAGARAQPKTTIKPLISAPSQNSASTLNQKLSTAMGKQQQTQSTTKVNALLQAQQQKTGNSAVNVVKASPEPTRQKSIEFSGNMYGGNKEHSPDRVSQGSQLSAKLSTSLKKVIENSAGKQGSNAALKMQEMLRKQQESSVSNNAKGRNQSAAGSDAGSRKGNSVGPFSPPAAQNGSKVANLGKINASSERVMRGSIASQERRQRELGTIQEGRRSTANLAKLSQKQLDQNHTFGPLNESVDMHNRTFQHDMQNQSFAVHSLQNQTVIEKSKLDGSMMLNKKKSVKQSRQNMVQLKHRIEALKRNVDAAQKKEEQFVKQRYQMEMNMQNKNSKELAKYALEEARQKQREDKKMRAQSARKERAESKMRVKEDLIRQRSSDVRQSKEIMAKRRAELDAAEAKKKQRKLATAAEVKRWKQEAAAKKQAQEQEFHSNVKKSYQERMIAQDSQASKNMQQLAELEIQEKQMVEMLNQSRMSMGNASSQAAGNNNNGSRLNNSVISPYKSKRQSVTTAKKSSKGRQQRAQFLGDEDLDLNDRIEYDRSIKIVNNSNKKPQVPVQQQRAAKRPGSIPQQQMMVPPQQHQQQQQQQQLRQNFQNNNQMQQQQQQVQRPMPQSQQMGRPSSSPIKVAPALSQQKQQRQQQQQMQQQRAVPATSTMSAQASPNRGSPANQYKRAVVAGGQSPAPMQQQMQQNSSKATMIK